MGSEYTAGGKDPPFARVFKKNTSVMLTEPEGVASLLVCMCMTAKFTTLSLNSADVDEGKMMNCQVSVSNVSV